MLKFERKQKMRDKLMTSTVSQVKVKATNKSKKKITEYNLKFKIRQSMQYNSNKTH